MIGKTKIRTIILHIVVFEVFLIPSALMVYLFEKYGMHRHDAIEYTLILYAAGWFIWAGLFGSIAGAREWKARRKSGQSPGNRAADRQITAPSLNGAGGKTIGKSRGKTIIKSILILEAFLLMLVVLDYLLNKYGMHSYDPIGDTLGLYELLFPMFGFQAYIHGAHEWNEKQKSGQSQGKPPAASEPVRGD